MTARAPQREVRRQRLARPGCTSSSRSASPIQTDPAFAGEDGEFDPALAPFDLTNGGSPLAYNQSFTIKQQAAYVQDDIKAGNATFKLGVRLDHYDGLTRGDAGPAAPRRLVRRARQRDRAAASYGRTHGDAVQREPAAVRRLRLERPVRRRPGACRRAGAIRSSSAIQQGFGRWLVADFGYFNKRTDNAYDFGVLFNTPIAFPVAWDHSRIDGFTGRINLVEHGGFSAFVVMAHTNAIFSPPGVGGILLEQPEGDFRIDHDQKFNSTTNLQYVFEKRTGAWAALSWRYDSGLVAGSVGEPRRCARADRRPAGGDRVLLRRQTAALATRRSRAADCTIVEFRRDAAQDSGRGHGGRCDESAADCAPAPVRPGARHRQRPAHRQGQAPGAFQRDQPDEQRKRSTTSCRRSAARTS